MRILKVDYLSILNSIYIAFIEKDNLELLPDESDDEKMCAFTSAYNVTDDQAMILAYLAHFYPSHISDKKLHSIQDTTDFFTAERSLIDLKERELITKRMMSDGQLCYAITEQVRNSFEHGVIIGKKRIECYKELKNTPLKKILDEGWKKKFYESARDSDDSQIWDAISTLGIKDCAAEVQDAFWALIWQFANSFTAPFAFRPSDGPLSNTGYEEEIMKGAMGELVKKGLAVTLPIEPLEDTKDTERYVIAVKAVELLFHGHEEFIRYEEISKQANVILAKDIAEKELFFPEKSQKDIDNLRRILSVEGFKRAKEILQRQKRNPGIQSLFWGPPGTGKTEVVKQLARESGRDIIMYDAAKATASAWGASEKFYRALFLGYSYLVAVSDKAPILMLNEADQLLNKRLTDVGSAIARAENTISNIVLQGFEDMSGILLATTNLAKNMDEAFDRRFLFKTELVRPDASTRKKIWKSSIPELSDEEAGKLAERFDMSGAQINNVVAKRNLAELYYEGDRDVNYIMGLCKEEVEEPIKGSSRKVGY